MSSDTLVGVMPIAPGVDPDEAANEVVEGSVGTAAVVVQVVGSSWPKPVLSILVSGLTRFSVIRLTQTSPYPAAKLKLSPESVSTLEDSDENKQLLEQMADFKEKSLALLDMIDGSSMPFIEKLKKTLKSMPPHELADIMASIIQSSFQEKIDILNAVGLEERFQIALPLLKRQLENIRDKQEENQSKRPRKIIIQHVRGNPGRRVVRRSDLGNEDDGDDDDALAALESKIK